MAALLSPIQIQTCQKNFPELTFGLNTIKLDHLNDKILGKEKQFAQDNLSPTEQERFFSFKYRKRQVEWLGGRVAAKKAVTSLLTDNSKGTPNFPALSIDATPQGRPVLHSKHVSSPIDISISHSGNLAVALAVSNGLCGIDIQVITNTVAKVKSRFASKAEEQIIRQLPCCKTYTKEVGLAMLWSAKEAFRKGVVCKPVLGFLEVSLEEVCGNIEQGLIGIFTCSRPGEARQMKAFFTIINTFAAAITYQPLEDL